VVYYFKGYFAATTENAQRVDFAVPSGNFGNILAAHVAREMGLPIRRLILATNENDVLDEFFRTGRYRPRSASETHATSSPSMDISKASNFERFHLRCHREESEDATRTLVDDWPPTADFDLSQTPHLRRKCKRPALFPGEARMPTAWPRFAKSPHRYGIVIDPHTADGVKVGLELRDPRHATHLRRNGAAGQIRRRPIREAVGRDPARPAVWRRTRDPVRSTARRSPPIRGSSRHSSRSTPQPRDRGPTARTIGISLCPPCATP
jgi:threonine synthase